MERKAPDLFSALLTGLLVNTLLRTQAVYGARAGVLSAPICALLLAGTAWLFARCWRAGQNPLFRVLFAALLAWGSVLELLRLWQLTGRLYPNAVSLTAICLTVLLPVLYLRRASALAQTARVLLCLLCAAGVFMLLSVLPRLHFTNLQTNALTPADFTQTAAARLTLYPEYLLPALFLPKKQKRSHRTLLYVSSAALAFDAGVQVLLELFYGAAVQLRTDPLHTAARCGALSVFNRLEWLQLILWIMAVTLKLALYLYAAVQLFGAGGAGENTAKGLGMFPPYCAGLWVLCMAFRRLDTDWALQSYNRALWLFAALVGLGGAAAWLFRNVTRRRAA